MSASAIKTRVGFLGLGTMGTPMARRLAKNNPLTVWNRSALQSRYEPLKHLGAKIGDKPADVLNQSDVTFTMLFDGAAIKSIMTDDFKESLRGKTLINTSSVPVEFSQYLDRYVRDAGGEFLEMPVSGSKVPAEQGKLVGLMAGDPKVAERVKPLVEPLTTVAVFCGPIGSGLKMKYALNLYLTTMNAGLAESMNLARAQGLDLEAFATALDAGPMASPYSKIKTTKMLHQDWSPQASARDCYNSTQLIRAAVEETGTQSPLALLSASLYRQAIESGWGDEDMISIYKVLQQPFDQNTKGETKRDPANDS
ncbi:unnamed protein product [Clonostachys rosea]|uniref:6-phosphogluconate dehydrogenase NADP-binding domain-containing protein n=1 Tax=Bionectria ochroleuca TaxID=29856 RepID=A0ABY6UGU9_BIOOC|nr:unnamed protein product [Clonostachys rosea]